MGLCEGSRVCDDEPHEAPSDPTVLFRDMINQTNEMHLITALHSVLCQSEKASESFNRLMERALLAVRRMSDLSEHLNRFGYFEVSQYHDQPSL